MTILLLTLVGCLSLSVPSSAAVISQWANSVRNFSTEWDSGSCAAANIVGSPEVYPNYGDLCNCWETCVNFDASGDNFIEIEVNTPVYVTSVSVFETWHGGGVIQISALRQDGSWQSLWNGSPTLETSSRIFSPQIVPTVFTTDAIRLDIRCSQIGADPNTIQLDAIQVDGSTTAPTKPVTPSTYYALPSGMTNVRLSVVPIRVASTTKSVIACGSQCAITNGCLSFNFSWTVAGLRTLECY